MAKKSSKSKKTADPKTDLRGSAIRHHNNVAKAQFYVQEMEDRFITAYEEFIKAGNTNPETPIGELHRLLHWAEKHATIYTALKLMAR